MLEIDELSKGIRRCAMNDHEPVARVLLESQNLQRIEATVEAFVAAAEIGHVDMMRLLVTHQSDLATSSTAANRALMASCENGHVEAVRFLVEELAVDINAPFSGMENRIPPPQASLRPGAAANELHGQRQYPIQIAVQRCSIPIIEYLLARGAKVDALGISEPILFLAARRESSSAKAIQLLLEAGATVPDDKSGVHGLIDVVLARFKADQLSPDIQGRFLVSPSLEYDFKEGPGASLCTILNHYPEAKAHDERFGLVLQMAAFLNNHSMVDLLLSRGADVNAVNYYYGTALQAAARRGHRDMVEKLIDAGADINILEGRWFSPLRAAIVGCHEQIVQLLLSHEANVHAKPKEKKLWERRTYERDSTMTSLQLAVETRNAAIVTALLSAGTDILEDESEIPHPLILSAGQGSLDITQQLLDAGAPVNIEGKMKYLQLYRDGDRIPKIRYSFEEPEEANPLHAAAANGDTRTIELLLERGTDIGKVVERHGSALTVAARKGHVDAVSGLLAAGSDVNVSSAIKETATDGMDSVTNSYNEVLSELLRAEVKTWHVPDALLVACTWRKLEVLELLLKSLYSKGDPEPTMEKVFSLPNLNDTVVELLLDYCGPTPRRFRQACKAGSSVAVGRIVRLGDFDINGEDEQTGEYPLYIAASNLHADVVNVLIEHGANVQVKSSKVPLPLLAALHACVVPLLKKSQSQKVKEWSITIGRPISPYFEHHAQPSISIRRVLECERIVHLLLENGADADGGIAGFGKPLHLACLIESKSMVRELLNHDADVNSLLECFDQTLWNDLGRDHPSIMEVLVEYGVDIQHVCEPLRERSLERSDMAVYDVFDEISSR